MAADQTEITRITFAAVGRVADAKLLCTWSNANCAPAWEDPRIAQIASQIFDKKNPLGASRRLKFPVYNDYTAVFPQEAASCFAQMDSGGQLVYLLVAEKSYYYPGGDYPERLAHSFTQWMMRFASQLLESPVSDAESLDPDRYDEPGEAPLNLSQMNAFLTETARRFEDPESLEKELTMQTEKTLENNVLARGRWRGIKAAFHFSQEAERLAHLTRLSEEKGETYMSPNNRKQTRSKLQTDDEGGAAPDDLDSALGFPINLPPGRIRAGRTPAGKMGYLVRTPANYDKSKPLPLLIYLHGGATYAAADAPFKPEDLKHHTPDDPWNLLDHDVLAFEQGYPFTLVADENEHPGKEQSAGAGVAGAAENGCKVENEKVAGVGTKRTSKGKSITTSEPGLVTSAAEQARATATAREQRQFPLASECIMLAPHVNHGHLTDDNGWWQWTYPDALENLFELLDLVINKLDKSKYFTVDRDRLFATGKSAGGTGVMSLVLASQGYDLFRWPCLRNYERAYGFKFAAVAIICGKGGRDDPFDPLMGDADEGKDATPDQLAMEEYLSTPFYPRPPTVRDSVLNPDCRRSSTIVHDDRTHSTKPPNGLEYRSADAVRRIEALMDTGVPVWLFVAEEDKWHAELFADHFFETCRQTLVDKNKTATVSVDVEKGNRRVSELVHIRGGKTHVRYTRYHRDLKYGHASWLGAYTEKWLRDWFFDRTTWKNKQHGVEMAALIQAAKTMEPGGAAGKRKKKSTCCVG